LIFQIAKRGAPQTSSLDLLSTLQASRPPLMKTSNIGLDILAGKDTTIEFEDFLGGLFCCLDFLSVAWQNHMDL
jgi:hypothetical protein